MKIGIIGANSQVGSSVALELKKAFDADIVCFTRSTYSHIYFEIFEIAVELIDFSNREAVKSKFKELDVLVDFTYPTGQLHQIKKALRENLELAISCLPVGATFVYMSSIMAYGMPPNELYIRDVFFPASSYAYFKRYAERTSLSLGKKYKVKIYNFRLGQVHGILQSVTRSFKQKLRDNEIVYVYGKSDDLTNVVFPRGIAESILQCAQGEHITGTYTIVKYPQWTLEELYKFYINSSGFTSKVVFVPQRKSRTSLTSTLLKFLSRYRLQLETYILTHLPTLAVVVKGKYRVTEVSSSLHRKREIRGNIDLNLLGVPSNKILSADNATIDATTQSENEFESFYNQTILSHRL